MLDKPFDDDLFIGCVNKNAAPFIQSLQKCPSKVFPWISMVFAEIFLMHKWSVFVKKMIRPLKWNDLIWRSIWVERNCRIHCFEIQKMNRIFKVRELSMQPFWNIRIIISHTFFHAFLEFSQMKDIRNIFDIHNGHVCQLIELFLWNPVEIKNPVLRHAFCAIFPKLAGIGGGAVPGRLNDRCTGRI